MAHRQQDFDRSKSPGKFALSRLARAIRSAMRAPRGDATRQLKFESLEPRILLSADPFTATLPSLLTEDWSRHAERLEISPVAMADLAPAFDVSSPREGLPDLDDFVRNLNRGAFDERIGGASLVLGEPLDDLLAATRKVQDNWIVRLEPIAIDQQQQERHVVFVDSRVAGYQDLLDSLLPVGDGADAAVPVIDIVVLDATRDGVDQISDYLAGQSGISAVHVLAHGASGSLTLGGATLDAGSLDLYADRLRDWGSALAPGADVLLYGCDIAAGEWGADFVNNLAALTGADVAASDDATGSEILGGDWDLELQIGTLEAAPIQSFLDVGLLPALLADGFYEVLEVSGTAFSAFQAGDLGTSATLDLSHITQRLDWTIGANGEVTVRTTGGDMLKVKDATQLKAGAGANVFIFLNNAEFGTLANPGSIVGNAAPGSTSTLSFTPTPDSPDDLFSSNRVSSGVEVDLNAPADVIHYGKVWFTATGLTKIVGGKGNDELDGRNALGTPLVGGRGDDILTGGDQGGDRLEGGVGEDLLIGGRGGDILIAGAGADELYGDSVVAVAGGDDSLAGGSGDDRYFFFDGWGDDNVTEYAGEGTDTLDMSGVTGALDVVVGAAAAHVSITDRAAPANQLSASFVENLSLGPGSNAIVVDADFGTSISKSLTIRNALPSAASPTTATLDLSALTAGVGITIENFAGSDASPNPNGNKVTVTFESGARLIVFNVQDIKGTDFDDRVTFTDGAVFAGTLDLGDGKNTMTVHGDLAGITGQIFGGDELDVLKFGSDVTMLDSLTATDRARLDALAATIAGIRNVADPGTLDIDALYGIRLTANVLDSLALDVVGFEELAVESGGSAGGVLFGGDSRLTDSAAAPDKADSLKGSSQDDILFGGQYDTSINGGKGRDIIVSGTGNETLAGEGGADVYVFNDNWGTDTITTTLTESANDTLDFTGVAGNLSFVLRGSKIFAANGTANDFHFDYSAGQFVNFDNSLTVKDHAVPTISNNIGTIKLADGAAHKFEFGNNWNSTTIEAPVGTQLVLDFSRVYEALRFDFKADGSLVVTQLGSRFDQLRDLVPGQAKSITITNVGANTTIVTGSNSNIYRVAPGATFDGQLNLTGGNKITKGPLPESAVTLPGSSVDHTIDLGQSLGTDAALVAGFLKNVFTGSTADAIAQLKAFGSSRVNVVDLLFNQGQNLFGKADQIIEGINNVNLLNNAKIGNVILDGLAVNIVQGNLAGNDFTTKAFRPGLHVVSGLTGPDNYFFNSFWGFGVVIEPPDLATDGIPLPEALDTLNFSGVIGQDMIVDVYDEYTDELGESLAALGIDPGPVLGSLSLESNFVVARSVIDGATTSLLFATDIESLVGPSGFSTLTVRLHGNAELRGTVAAGAGGDVVLDYSNYDGPVSTRLETLNIPLGDLSLENLGIEFAVNTVGGAVGDAFGFEMPRSPENTTGSATGIGGNRIGGITTLFDFFASLATGEQQSLLSDFGVITATKVIGSANADTHILSSAAKEYVIGAGDNLVRPEAPNFFGAIIPAFLEPDLDAIGLTTISFDDSVVDGVFLDLGTSTDNLVIDGMASDVFSPTDLVLPDGKEETFGYRIVSSAGDDHFIGSARVDTFIFEGDWGHDRIELGGNDEDVVDVLDFSAFSNPDGTSPVTGRWDGRDLVFELKDSAGVVTSSVTVVDAALAGRDGNFAWKGADDAIPAPPPIVVPLGSLGVPLLSATPGAPTPIDVATIESRLVDALMAFDGRSITPVGEGVPVTLAVQDVVDPADGSTVWQILRSDTNAVLLSSTDFSFAVDNLAGTELSVRDTGGTITIDTTAADHGWYTSAAAPGAGEPGVDLLSVLSYEIGLKLGLDATLDVMDAMLDAGERNVISGDLGQQVDVVDNLSAVVAAALPPGSLTAADDLSAVLARAIAEWSAQSFLVAGEPWFDAAAVLDGVKITIGDLEGDEVARTLEDGSIVLDYSAAGNGWFVDATPGDDEATEFADVGGVLTAVAGGPADGRIDLLTALMHELGHMLGVTHDGAAGALMATELETGIRRDIPGGVISHYEIDADGQQALADGLAAFSSWAAGLGENLDGLLDDTSIPFTDQSLRDLLGIETSVANLVADATTALQQALAGIFGGGNVSAADILALSGLSSAEFVINIGKSAGTNPNAFAASIDLQPGSAPLANLDLSGFEDDSGPLTFTIDGGLTLTVTADLELTFEFGLDTNDAFYVAAPELDAQLAVTSGAAGVNIGVSLGPLGLNVVDGSIDLTATAAIGTAAVMNTASLTARAVDPTGLLADTSGGYAVELPIALSGGIAGLEGNEAVVRASGILPTGNSDLLSFLNGMNVEFENFDQLFQLRGLSLDDLLGGIITFIDFINDPSGLLHEEVPGLGQSVSELISGQLGLGGTGFLTHIKTEIEKVRDTGSLTGAEDALNSIFNNLFGAGTDPVTITLEDSVILLDLAFEELLAQLTQSFSLDLAAFANELGLGDLIGPQNIDAVADKLGIGSTGINLFADVVVGFDIGVGLDLRNVFDPTRIISSDTGVFVRVDAGMDPVDFDVSLDISDLGLGAVGLPIPLTDVGFSVREATADLDLLLEFGLPDNDDGFYAVGAVPDAEASASGQASIDLPLNIGNYAVGGTDQDTDGDGIPDNVLHVGATFTNGDVDFEFASPGMDQLLSLAGFLNDPNNVVAGLDKIFEALEFAIGGQLGSLDLPFIGGALSGAQGFFDDGVDGSGEDLRELVVGRLEDLIAANPGKTTIELVAQALIEGFQSISPDIANQLGVTVGADFFEFDLELADTLLSKEIAIDLGLGDLLSFGPDGKVMIDVGYTFAFGFGFSLDDGFYLNTDGATEGGEEFLLDIAATIDGLEFTGALPLLAITVKDLTGSADDNDNVASGILGGFSVDLQDAGNDGRLSIGEGANVDARLVAEANVDLGFEVKIGDPASPGTALFPTINTTFRYDQVLADVGTTGTTIAATPTVVFEDVELNLGEFITGFVKPIVDDVAEITRPLQPLVDLLTAPIELLDQLGLGQVNMLDLAEGILGQGEFAGVVRAVDAIADVVTLVNTVDDFIANAGNDPLIINFGSFTVVGGQAAPDAGNPDPGQEASNAGGGAAAGVVSGFSGGGFEFPLLTDPATIFGLLLGEDVDLFIYNLPELSLNIDYVKSFPIFPGLNARFGGAIAASTNLSFGFDTSGFNDWKQGGFLPTDVLMVLDGFFVDDHVTFDANGNIIEDLPEATVQATIIAGASVGVSGLVEAGVDGGITGSLEFDLNDIPNPGTGSGTSFPAVYDGKLRGDELVTRLLQTDELFPGFLIPCVFDIEGRISFGLDAFFWVGVDLGFLGKATIFEARERFLSGVLASFNFHCPDPAPAILADVDANGVVSLRAGEADGAFTVARQSVVLQQGQPAEDLLVIRTGSSFHYIPYEDVTKLVFNGTEGDDQLIVGAGLDGIELEIDGKGGNDRIALASGGLAVLGGGGSRVVVRGGAGHDEIVIAETVGGDLDVDGGSGNDHIMVSSQGSNAVLIRGGDGNDTIIGSEFRDEIYGGAGRDIIQGMGGNDLIYGGDLDQAALDAEIAAAEAAGTLPPFVDDLIFGGEGNDEIYGGSGNDRLFGEEGEDRIYGQDGEDTLNGGLDVDELYGGADRDTIAWSYGDGVDRVWDGGDGTTIDADQFADTVQLSGVVLDDSGATIATDDTVTLSRSGIDDVAVTWARTGVPGSMNAFTLTNIEQVSVNLGSGNDELTVNDLDGSTVSTLNVDFGTTETITREILNEGTDDEEEFLVRNVETDSETDILNLFGSAADDVFTVETTTTGLLIQQSERVGGTNRNILNLSVFNPGAAEDRLNIDTGDGDDVIDASAVSRNDLTAIGMTAGNHDDTVVGSPFIDDIDSGFGDDRVSGGGGVDLFRDEGGFDRLFEARDVNFTLSDVSLVSETLDAGEAVEQPDGSFKVTRNVTGTETEDISDGVNPLFEEVYLTGYDLSQGIDDLNSVNIFNVADFTGDAFLNGGAAADVYNIQLSGGASANFTSFIDIVDDGGANDVGVDVLNIEGTNEADVFHFDTDIVQRISSAEGAGTVDLFQRAQDFTVDIEERSFGDLDPSLNVQTVNYKSTEDMVIHGRGGDDLFIVDDSSTELFVYGDSGDDSFFIGSVLATATRPNPNGGPDIVVVDRNAENGGITNGVSFPAEFHGGKGNDYFEVNHNIAEISLYGEDGDDIFFLKALLTTEPLDADGDGVPDENYAQQEDINVFSEEGQRDTIAYVNNAPVNIFGGEGFDTLVIVGTVLDDTFVIFTEFDEGLGRDVQRIYGAGLVVPTIDSIERVQLITGAGDDKIFLYGTLEDQEIVINTGSGNDLVQIGGPGFNFDVTIPESQYTKINVIPQPDVITTETITTPARTWYTWEYERLFGFFGPRWIPTLVRHHTPASTTTRVISTPQAPLEIPEVVLVPEFRLEVAVPESRDLAGIHGPVFIDGQQAGGGHDSIVVDNRNGLTVNPGLLEKNTVEMADINTGDGEAVAASGLLESALPAGIDVAVVYEAVVNYLEDQNRVRQPGLLDQMLADPAGLTTIELRPGQRIQAFAGFDALQTWLGNVSVTEGSYQQVNAVSGVTETQSFQLADLLPTGGNEFLPDDVFNVDLGGTIGIAEVELLYDVNGVVIGANVFAESALSFEVSNAFVQSKVIDADATRTYDALSGFGLGVGIFYENFSLIDVQLSNSDDVLTINDTTGTAVTNVFAGGGDDRIEVNDTGGTLHLFGDVAGSDTAGLVSSNVAGAYSESFRDADNAAALGTVLGLGMPFDPDDIAHIKLLAHELNARFAHVSIPDPDNSIFKVINLDVDRYSDQVWELLKNDINVLQGEDGDYRNFLVAAADSPFADFAADLATYAGFPGVTFDPANRDHLAGLAAKVNAQAFPLTVAIDLAGNVNELRRDLDVFLSFVADLLGPAGLDIANGAEVADYKNFLPALGDSLQLGQDFDLNNRSHLQLLANLVNQQRFTTTVAIDESGTADELGAALGTFQNFVWTTLKFELTMANGDAYNPLAETGDYRERLTELGDVLGLEHAFDAGEVGDVRALAAALNEQFPSLGLDVDDIRLVPNIDLDVFELEIWKLITEIDPQVVVPFGDDVFNVQRTGAEVVIRGQDGNDTVNLNGSSLGAWLAAYGQGGDDEFNVHEIQSLTSMSDRGEGVSQRDTIDFDGGDGGDDYFIDLTGEGDYRVNVLDTGTMGEDNLTIDGTDLADTFLLRRVTNLPGYEHAVQPAFVALLQGSLDEILANSAERPQSYERINYDANIDGFLTVNGLAGDDYFASDDNAARTILDGGAGGDTFQIGQVYRTPRVAGSLDPDDLFDTIQTTRGFLSNGVSFDTTIIGGTEDDRVTVYSNQAELTLKGNEGNDTFEVRAFELASGGFSTDGDTAIETGDGDDTVQYNVNAPVSIDGGAGFDSVVVLGTESNDSFVITDTTIFGAGLTVNYENAESVQVDGLEGDDDFFILSTSADIVTTVIGGLGSDTFNVGGDVTEEIVSAGWDGAELQDHELVGIHGPLIIEGHYLEGANRSLAKPVMLPGETDVAMPDGDVLAFDGQGAAAGLDAMQAAQSAVAAVLGRIGAAEDDYDALVGLTLEITDGAGEGRFWSIVAATLFDADTVEFELRNPSVLESAGIADIVLPDTSSEFAVSQLSANFFANEADQVDRLNVYNDGSLSDDVGYLTAVSGDNGLVPLEAPVNLYFSNMNMTGYDNAGEGVSVAAGITMDDLEILEVLLGQGNDTFTVEATLRNAGNHGGLTIVHGGGNAEIEPGVMGGDTIVVNGGGGTDSPLVVYGDTSQQADRYVSTPGQAFAFDHAGDDVIDARNASESVTLYGGAGDDTIWGGQAGDNLAGGSGSDEIHGQSGVDHVYGDSGINVDPLSRLMTVPTVNAFASPNTDYLAVGDDLLYGDEGDDIVFGDHGIVTPADPGTALWSTAHPGINRIETAVWNEGGDDILHGGADADMLFGGSNRLHGDTRGGDAIDGGTGDDLIFGDNAVLLHRAEGSGQAADPRTRVLDGAELYDAHGYVAASSPVDSAHPQVHGSWADYEIVNLDHSRDVEEAAGRNFGDDYIAGGADDDTIFGQLGDDVIQGDGSIGDGVSDRVDAGRDEAGMLTVNASTESATDGDDYIEGNGGDDVIFGNLGQDDIVGGSSSLFSLDDPSLRPDGSDTIFGGAGLRIARNYQVVGDTDPDTILLDSVHANDSDAIVGDNGNIYRIVGTDGVDSGGLLVFNYDQGRGPESIVVRAIDLIDYTPGGVEYDASAAADIGAGDEVHGESGDDFIYGQKGSDHLFGDSEDDDIVGGYGSDWISGGAGSDGILGDDGRIYTSRNEQGDPAEFAEPLYGISKLAETNVEISTPGDAQLAIINPAGELKKTVNLTPFNVDPMEDNLYEPQDADDIVFGGLGDDFLHGGSGDDAMSGAEAIAGGFAVLYGDGTDANRDDGVILFFGFDNPGNPGNILGYSALRAGEFAEYDEFNPRQRILGEGGAEYFLNFNADEGELLADGSFSDGNDAIFGDLGNDWIVGGTGRDNLYGGYGDDLLNADDDLGTNGGLNDTTDTGIDYGDRAFGGAGRDVLNANTGADRLIDWAGEFNSYLVPFGIFGVPTISRAVPPALFDFLYDLSAADGADPTRAADTGNGADRNGEPFGELGLVTQNDFDWQLQTGAPADVQPGNIPGGERDVVQVATFNQGTAEGFLPDVGDWSVENSRLQVQPETLGGDAVSVYYVNDILPSYFELQAVVQGGKPTAGLKSNAYLIFDYQSPTDFKFAGVNVSTDKLEIGHRDETGWHVDVQLPAQLRPDRDYNLLLAINGTTATLLVNNRDFLTHTFDARVDADGYSYGLNAGLVGIGANNSRASIDNVRVQVLPKDVMPVRHSDFEGGFADFLVGDTFGQWDVADGHLIASSAGGLDTDWGGAIAYTTSDVRIAAGQVLEIETTLAAGAHGGIVFDQYGSTDFKFVYIDGNGNVSIGHQSGSTWAIDASAALPQQVSGDFDIKVSLVGSTVNVLIDDQTVLSFAYNALTGDGAVGLLAVGDGVRFDSVVISTNDPAYLDAIAGDPLRAAIASTDSPGVALAAGTDLQPLLDAAIQRWTGQLGYAIPGAGDLQVWVTDLRDDLLGLTIGNVIYIDRDAAGLGWYVDETPGRDEGFAADGSALAGSDAGSGVDLLSVISHELGHVAGLSHEVTGGETLGVGQRTLADLDVASDQRLREILREQRLRMIDSRAGIPGGIAPGDAWHQSRQVVDDIVASLSDPHSRIVPVNLGMFPEVRRQVPRAFDQANPRNEAQLRALIWNEDAGEFDPTPAGTAPVHGAARADAGSGDGLFEFLDDDFHPFTTTTRSR